jgi:tetratricopeptide (TPR) repeat protein
MSAFLVFTGSAEEATRAESEPAYKVLYEQGFYEDAINLLDSIIAQDTVENQELLFYLASSYIARGNLEAGGTVFERILDNDPDFQLDTLFTPPKILAVFHDVRFHRASHTEMADTSTITQDSTATVADTVTPTISSDNIDTAAVEPTAALTVDTVRTGLHPVLEYSVGLLPGGVGQFYQRKPYTGVLLFAAQVTSIVGCVWSARKREMYYDGPPNGYGWYDKNRAEYNRYTNYNRLGVGVIIGSYTYGLIDYFWGVRKKRE